MLNNVRELAAAMSAGLLTLSAVVPTETASAQSPMRTRGKTWTMTSPAATAPGAVIAPTPNPELVFEPMQPCRAFYTGASNGGGPIPTNTTRSFYVSGTTGFDGQGGTSGGCGVPASAAAVAIALTVYNTSSGLGKIVAYPYGPTTFPPSTTVSYTPGTSPTSGAVIGVNQAQISVYAKTSSAQVAGDITGYFAPQIQAYIAANGSIYNGTARIISSSHIGTGQYQVVVDRDVSFCTTVITPGYLAPIIATGYGDTNNNIIIDTFGQSNGSFVAADAAFNVIEVC